MQRCMSTIMDACQCDNCMTDSFMLGQHFNFGMVNNIILSVDTALIIIHTYIRMQWLYSIHVALQCISVIWVHKRLNAQSIHKVFAKGLLIANGIVYYWSIRIRLWDLFYWTFPTVFICMFQSGVDKDDTKKIHLHR